MVLGDRGRAAHLGVPQRVLAVEDGEADAGIPADVPLLATAGLGGDEEVVAVPADPHHRGLRRAVGVERGEYGAVRGVEEPAYGVGE